MARRLARLIVVGAVVLHFAGCSFVLGDHPFSSLPNSDFGEKPKFSPEKSLVTSTSIAYKVYAIDKLRTPNGDMPVKNVTFFATITEPHAPWDGAEMVLVLTNDVAVYLGPSEDYSWSISGPFGVGSHRVKWVVFVKGVPVYERVHTFTVLP